MDGVTAIKNWKFLTSTLCRSDAGRHTRFFVQDGLLGPDSWYGVGGRYSRTVLNLMYETYNRDIVLSQLNADISILSRYITAILNYFKQPYILPNIHHYSIVSKQTQWYINLYRILSQLFEGHIYASEWIGELTSMYPDDQSICTIEEFKQNLDVLRLHIVSYECLLHIPYQSNLSFSSPLNTTLTTDQMDALYSSLFEDVAGVLTPVKEE